MAAYESSGRPLSPLQGVSFRVLGSSRVGRQLATLLSAQGAERLDPKSRLPKIDLIIDDRTADDGVSEAVAGSSGQIILKLVDYPPSHPESAKPSRLVDELIHAELGINALSGMERDAEPLRIASTYGAVWGAIYIAAALRERDVTGQGARIQISLFAATLTALGRNLIEAENPLVLDSVARPLLPLADIYECADGRFVQSHGTYPRFAEILCEVAGHPEWRKAAVAGLDGLADLCEVEMWRDRFAAQFRKQDALWWEEAINRAGGSCTICRSREEWLATAHARSLGIAKPPLPEIPGICLYEPHPASSSTPAPTRRRTRPELPLSGIRVIDFCIVLAGPTCGRTLAELGADVIKVDQVDRKQSTYAWLDVNRTKRSILLDLKKPEGLKIARTLIESADVVSENFRRGKLDELGLGFNSVRAIVPDIIFSSLNAFDFGGEWSMRAGWEHNAQAMTGMQIARAVDGVAKAVPLPLNDYATGLLGAYGIILALRHRDKSGASVRVAGSLARTASLIQSEELAGEAAERGPSTRRILCRDGDLRVRLRDLDERDAGIAALLARARDTDRDRMADMLRAQGVYVAVERSQEEVRCATDYRGDGLRLCWRNPHWGDLRQVTMRPSRSEIAMREGWPAPDPGDDSKQILRELGYSAEEAARLVASGAVTARMPLFGGEHQSAAGADLSDMG